MDTTTMTTPATKARYTVHGYYPIGEVLSDYDRTAQQRVPFCTIAAARAHAAWLLRAFPGLHAAEIRFAKSGETKETVRR